ncbi:5'/3'-nucleotidase SurE [Actinomadura kijaniata]|uniref:5'/3'-nucleotidase SurE n=1 Tax=Actinomadura kijaniata TaxID=46161 RepID=UPI000A0200AB|nr:5'/3'-nucleotidase SurE [Actinomadura kijaniata]
MRPNRRAVVVATAAALLTPVLPAAASPGPRPDRPLRILLSNDDGHAAPGIRAVFDALTAAGHDVTIVAPATNQSGAGAKRTVEDGHVVRARQVSDRVWAVEGTPGDSVLFGLGRVFAGRKVDLVVSGTNLGQNVGAINNNSGTVGAAVTAIDMGVPAVAVSTQFDFANVQNTIANMPATAAFTARLVDRLRRDARGGALLPAHSGISVNYPTRPNLAAPAGVALTRPTRETLFSVAYEPDGSGGYRMKPVIGADIAAERDSDWAALEAGKVSVTPIDADWGASGSSFARTAARIKGLR